MKSCNVTVEEEVDNTAVVHRAGVVTKDQEQETEDGN